MGNRGGHEIRYYPDPAQAELLKQLQASNTELAKKIERSTQELAALEARSVKADQARAELQRELKEMLDREKDPAKIVENQERLFDNFVKHVKTLFPEDGTASIALTNAINVCFIGKVSTGKSSLINALIGQRVAKSGLGRTTTEVKRIASMSLYNGDVTIDDTSTAGPTQSNPTPASSPATGTAAPATGPTLRVFDVPGDDDKFNYLSVDGAMAELSMMHVIVILFHDTPCYAIKYARLAKAMGKRVVFVRTQLDNADPTEMSWRDEVDRDEKTLRKMVGPDLLTPEECTVYGVSARSILDAALKMGPTAGPTESVERYHWDDFCTHIRNIGMELHKRRGLDSAPKYTIAMSHTWGTTPGARDTHDRVVALADKLRTRGYSVFVDNERMRGNVAVTITAGIDQASVVLACLTSAYLGKVRSNDGNFSCVRELQYAVKKGARIVPVVLETQLRTPGSWSDAPGLAQAVHADASTDTVDDIVRVLTASGIPPS